VQHPEMVLAMVLHTGFGSGSRSESNNFQIGRLGCQYIRTGNSVTVNRKSSDPAEFGGLSVGCPVGPSVE